MKLVIDKLIEEKGLKMGYVAKKIGVNRDTVSNWCYNRSMPRLDVANELAKVLQVDINDLFEE
ncbi:helix-turn-helix transcriptional regulator [Virgibacillus salexigens]|uniref:HTH cro/C1-type domain-containing protein n=1 Tax=Virgibacillus kapii TaxID=1638645 RepID=A0ABQ2D767_9BACI|nr:helix-turn-helix transcriptional regulator [Virgibacillus kapii]GGJ48395.1 hypothetical protein GCM10007111_08070 [Virgibacillus kapii]